MPNRCHVLTDHYGWRPHSKPLRRVQRVGSQLVEGTLASGEELRGQAASSAIGAEISLKEVGLGDGRLQVLRLPTLTVWEALATAVLRQVVRAHTARERFCRVVDAVSPDQAFPAPAMLLACGEREMGALGLRFCWPKLTRLAGWAQETGADQAVGPDGGRALLEEAAGLSGLGPWSLAVAAWDVSCDPLHYPVGDFVVQAGAASLFDDRPWARKPDEFELEWRTHCGAHLGPLTLLALVVADPRGQHLLRDVAPQADRMA